MSWSQRTAELIRVCLANGGSLSPQSLRRFAAMPPRAADVAPLLPQLEQWTAHSDERRVAAGDLAARAELLPRLSPEFQAAYVGALRRTNPFRALQLLPRLPAANSAETRVRLLLAAQQPERADAEAQRLLVAPPAALVRALIAGLADPGRIQAWIDRWQAPSPTDVAWLHHTLRARGITGLRLPPLLASEAVPTAAAPTTTPAAWRVPERVRNLAAAVSALAATVPHLLDADSLVCRRWTAAMAAPSVAKLAAVAQALADAVPDDNDDDAAAAAAALWSHAAWLKVLRHVDASTAAVVAPRLRPLLLRARGFAAAIARAPLSDLPRLLSCAGEQVLYTPEVLAALAARSPAMFAEAVVPEDTPLARHHLVALWRAAGSGGAAGTAAEDVAAKDVAAENATAEWLLDQTLAQGDAIVLRAAARSLRRSTTNGNDEAEQRLARVAARAEELGVPLARLLRRQKVGRCATKKQT